MALASQIQPMIFLLSVHYTQIELDTYSLVKSYVTNILPPVHSNSVEDGGALEFLLRETFRYVANLSKVPVKFITYRQTHFAYFNCVRLAR